MTSLAEALTGPGGTERPFHCPVHADTHPSASVNVISGLWICYTCGAKGKAGDGYTVDPDQLLSYLQGLKKRHQVQHYFPESWLDLYTGEADDYWRARFTEEACEHFQLGYDAETDSATYPLRDAGGHLLGVVRRPLSKDWDGGKYIYPRFVDVTRYLFNYDGYQGRRKALLVEGAADAVAAWEAGYEAYAIFGSRITIDQIRLLYRVGVQEVWTCFDNDDAGYKAHLRCVSEIDLPVNQVFIPEGAKDLGELSIDEREVALSFSLGEPDHERVVSTTCESASQAPPPSAPMPSSGTPGPGTLRIRRTSK